MTPRENRKGSANLRNFYLALAGVAVVGLAALGYAVLGGSSAAVEPVELSGVDDPRALLAKANGVALGEADAPVTVLEFADYQCPACREFTRRVKPVLEMDYIRDGQVRFVFYDLPLTSIHKNAFIAARAARCADDQGGFWQYHDRLYAEQSRWASQDRVVDDFADYAEELGLDGAAFEGCLNSDRHADVVTAGRELAIRLGVTSTPTLIVNQKRVGDPFDYPALKRLIEEELGR